MVRPQGHRQTDAQHSDMSGGHDRRVALARSECVLRRLADGTGQGPCIEGRRSRPEGRGERHMLKLFYVML